jgi:hypothetical protein
MTAVLFFYLFSEFFFSNWEKMSKRKQGNTIALYTRDSDDYSSEDEEINQLQKTGALEQVVGSQSLLSQELHSLDEMPTFSQEVAGLSQASVNTTVTCSDFDSQAAAHKYGLLSQDPAADGKSSQETTPEKTKKISDSQESLENNSQFGTLLDAVQIFQSQEEQDEINKAKIFSQEAMKDDPVLTKAVVNDSQSVASDLVALSQQSSSPSKKQTGKAPAAPSPRRGNRSVAAAKKNETKPKKADAKRSTKKRPLSEDTNKRKPGKAAMVKGTALSASRKRRRMDDAGRKKQQEIAHRAAELAQRTINDPDLAKRLLLSMALTRENPRSAPSVLPGKGHSLPEGFFWAHYPPLEKGTFQFFVIDGLHCSIVVAD